MENRQLIDKVDKLVTSVHELTRQLELSRQQSEHQYSNLVRDLTEATKFINENGEAVARLKKSYENKDKFFAAIYSKAGSIVVVVLIVAMLTVLKIDLKSLNISG